MSCCSTSLRDYRFYAEDMVHPSEAAVQLCLGTAYPVRLHFCRMTLRIMEESENIRRALAHKPFHPDFRGV